MSLLNSPAFNTYEPVPTTPHHRREAVELHVPRGEWHKPEMRRFIEGKDLRSRPHLTATAQAIARAEIRTREAYEPRMKLAEHMYRVWAFLTLWSTFEGRDITWARPHKKKGGGRRLTSWYVCATTANKAKTKAFASGRDPFDAAEILAAKLGLL